MRIQMCKLQAKHQFKFFSRSMQFNLKDTVSNWIRPVYTQGDTRRVEEISKGSEGTISALSFWEGTNVYEGGGMEAVG